MTRTGYLYASYFYPKIWMEALGKGQVKYCKAHSLRHYYGSRLLYAGVPENDVADWMGHSSTDVLRSTTTTSSKELSNVAGPPSRRC